MQLARMLRRVHARHQPAIRMGHQDDGTSQVGRGEQRSELRGQVAGIARVRARVAPARTQCATVPPCAASSTTVGVPRPTHNRWSR